MLLFAGLVWAALVRLPFAWRPTIDGDGALFWLVGDGWLHGRLPYAAIWDVKPPGIFLLFAGVAKASGADPVGGRLLTALAVGLATAGLARAGDRLFANRAAGLCAAALYPPFTLLLDGLGCKPELLAAPFVVWGVVLALDEGAGIAAILAAGLLIGFAGTIKQTAIFEAGFVAILLGLRDSGGAVIASRAAAWRSSPVPVATLRIAAFVAGLAIAPLAFCVYFAAHGMLRALIDSSVLGAAARLHGDGGGIAGAPVRLLAALKPALVLLLGAGLCWAERRRIVWAPRARLVLWGWLGAAALGAIAMRAAYPPYALPLLPPLCLASGLLLARLWEARRAVAIAAGLLALTSPLVARRLLPEDGAEDPAPAAVAAAIRQAAPGRPIYVVDYEPLVYQLAGAPVPTRYPLPQHLLCDFPALPADPQAEIARIMASLPAALVVSASRHRMACERPDRVGTAMRLAVAAGYRRTRVFATPYGPVELWLSPSASPPPPPPDRAGR